MSSYLFGPVPSRRLGISLGVDLVPAKTCSLNCIYCESGRTTTLTVERREYVPTAEVIDELTAFLGRGPNLDYITFSGAGEPTLHSGIGTIVRYLKDRFPAYRLCLLTNGTLLGDKDLAEEILPVDLIIPSLDVGEEESFQKINRPASGISCSGLIAGLAAFRQSYTGDLCLEIFVVPGLNDSSSAVQALRDAVARIHPDKIQLNTLDRPGTEPGVAKAAQSVLGNFMTMLSPLAEIEVVGKFTGIGKTGIQTEDLPSQILKLINRRPCTAQDLVFALDLNSADLQPILQELVDSGSITMEYQERGIFYRS